MTTKREARVGAIMAAFRKYGDARERAGYASRGGANAKAYHARELAKARLAEARTLIERALEAR